VKEVLEVASCDLFVLLLEEVLERGDFRLELLAVPLQVSGQLQQSLSDCLLVHRRPCSLLEVFVVPKLGEGSLVQAALAGNFDQKLFHEVDLIRRQLNVKLVFKHRLHLIEPEFTLSAELLPQILTRSFIPPHHLRENW